MPVHSPFLCSQSSQQLKSTPSQLILLSGYPSSGKTHRTQQLLSYFQTRISTSSSPISALKIVHINDQTLSIPRSAYREAKTEKEARGAFYTAVKRALGRDTIVVADGMNYIKGFRYQLYCEAKGVRTTNCVVSSSTPSIQPLTMLWYEEREGEN